jgi:cytochrome P450
VSQRPQPIVEFDPFSLETLNDPFSIYHRLLEDEPLHWSPIWGVWLVSRYEDVRNGLQDNRLSARHNVAQLGVSQDVDLGIFAKVPTLPTTDPPAHTRLRKLVNRAFTPAAVEQLREQVVAIVEERLAAAAERRQLRVVEDIAGPLPTLAIAQMLGIPEADAPLLKMWSDDLLVAFEGHRPSREQLDAAAQACRDFEAYLRKEIRTRSGGDDLLARLRQASVEGEFLSEDEVISTCILLLLAGNETTTSLVANGMYALMNAPHQLRRLQAEPELVPTAVEEFLRYCGPVQMILRTATVDVEFGGGTVAQGEAIAFMIGAADRDPRQFPDPDDLHIDRTPNDHLAFGRSRHFCLGAPLARLEAQAVFRGLLQHFDDLEMEAGSRPAWSGSMQARRIDELNLRVAPRKPAPAS